MTQAKLVEALIANGFEVKQTESLDVYYQGEPILSLDDNKRVVKIREAVNGLSEYKFGQLLHIVKKYQDLIFRESVVTF